MLPADADDVINAAVQQLLGRQIRLLCIDDQQFDLLRRFLNQVTQLVVLHEVTNASLVLEDQILGGLPGIVPLAPQFLPCIPVTHDMEYSWCLSHSLLELLLRGHTRSELDLASTFCEIVFETALLLPEVKLWQRATAKLLFRLVIVSVDAR